MKKDLTKAHSPQNPRARGKLVVRSDTIIFKRWVTEEDELPSFDELRLAFQKSIQDDFTTSIQEVYLNNRLIKDMFNFGLGGQELTLYQLGRRYNEDTLKEAAKFISYLTGTRYLTEDVTQQLDSIKVRAVPDMIKLLHLSPEIKSEVVITRDISGRFGHILNLVRKFRQGTKDDAFVMLYTISETLERLSMADERFTSYSSLHAVTGQELIGAGVWPYKGAMLKKYSLDDLFYLGRVFSGKFEEEQINSFMSSIEHLRTISIDEYYDIPVEYIELLETEFTWKTPSIRDQELAYFSNVASEAVNTAVREIKKSIIDKLSKQDTVRLRDILKLENIGFSMLVPEPQKIYRLYTTFNLHRYLK